MPDVPDEAAYYLNRKIPAVALIAKGVRLPAGKWIRVASATCSCPKVEQHAREVFPDLKGRVLDVHHADERVRREGVRAVPARVRS